MRLYARYLGARTRFPSTTTLSPTVTMRSASEVDATIEAACAADSHGAQTLPRHPSLPSSEAGGAAGGACKLGLPRHRGVRVTTFQPNLTVLYQLLVEPATTVVSTRYSRPVLHSGGTVPRPARSLNIGSYCHISHLLLG